MADPIDTEKLRTAEDDDLGVFRCWRMMDYAADEIDRLRVEVDQLRQALRLKDQEIERAHLARIEAQNPGIDIDRVARERRYLLDAEWHYCVDSFFGWLAFESPFARAAKA
jgi:hypothetical protein